VTSDVQARGAFLYLHVDNQHWLLTINNAIFACIGADSGAASSGHPPGERAMSTFDPASFIRLPEAPHAWFRTEAAVREHLENALAIERAIASYKQHCDRRLLALDLADQGFDRNDAEEIAADPDSFTMGYA
jgi:hypothetical protein